MSLATLGPNGPNSVNERIALRNGVPNDAEFERIDRLPRRVWATKQALSAVLRLTKQLRTRLGERTLWPDQSIALTEIGFYGGTVCGIRVSGGKTTIAFLAGTMLPDCARPLLIAPSKSIRTGKVAAAYAEERKHWRVRSDYSWLSYHDLQKPTAREHLNSLRPGLIIFDEAHHVGRYDSRRTRVIRDYLGRHPSTPVIVLTGSLIASRVDSDALELSYWARKEHSPLPHPTAANTRRFWKLALGAPSRLQPGALRRWCRAGESTVTGLGRRYYETPGVVCSAGENVIGTSLTADVELVRLVEPKVLAGFDYIRTGRGPDGAELLDADGSNTWLVAQTLALGFYYVLDPKPPTDWLDAYRNWCAYCREHIKSDDCACDSEATARQHILESDSECWPLNEWLLVKDKYQRKRKAVWLDSARLDAVCRWMDTHKHGIVWSQFRGFSEALAIRSKKPYYGSQAQDRRTGKYITEHPAGRPCIASIKTCSEDLNLQKQFYQNLFPAPPATGAWHEQAIARTHRFGCSWPEVEVTYWAACAENRDNLTVAKLRERNAAAMTGDPSRKLLIADFTNTAYKTLEGPQWTKTKIAQKLMT